jgi:hypothetical protein
VVDRAVVADLDEGADRHADGMNEVEAGADLRLRVEFGRGHPQDPGAEHERQREVTLAGEGVLE